MVSVGGISEVLCGEHLEKWQSPPYVRALDHGAAELCPTGCGSRDVIKIYHAYLALYFRVV